MATSLLNACPETGQWTKIFLEDTMRSANGECFNYPCPHCQQEHQFIVQFEEIPFTQFTPRSWEPHRRMHPRLA